MEKSYRTRTTNASFSSFPTNPPSQGQKVRCGDSFSEVCMMRAAVSAVFMLASSGAGCVAASAVCCSLPRQARASRLECLRTPKTFERLVLHCIEADFCKSILTHFAAFSEI